MHLSALSPTPSTGMGSITKGFGPESLMIFTLKVGDKWGFDQPQGREFDFMES